MRNDYFMTSGTSYNRYTKIYNIHTNNILKITYNTHTNKDINILENTGSIFL